MPAFTGFRFDRAKFFAAFRAQFGAIPQGKQYVVDGLNRLLTGFETYYGWWDDLSQIANAFAQVGWETAFSYTPVVEAYYLGDPDQPGYFQGNTSLVTRVQQRFWYWPHIGRGDIQCTHAENYAEADAYIRKYFPERVTDFEARTGQKFNLVTHPMQMLDGWISFCTFTVGMHLGLFRHGHNLDRYINPVRCDHFNARGIVNGDKNIVKRGSTTSIGRQIEAIAKGFEKILKASLTDNPLTELTDGEIHMFGEQIGEAPTGQTGAAEPNAAGNGGPFISPVEPGAGAMPGLWPGDAPAPPGETEFTESETIQMPGGEKTVEHSTTIPAGDPPEAPPSRFFNFEDWKPWAIRWATRIWKGVGTATGLGTTGFSFAAISSGENWWVWAVIGAGVLLLFLGIGILATLVVAGIWLYQNRRIPDIKHEVLRIAADPNLKNVGVRFEPK